MEQGIICAVDIESAGAHTKTGESTVLTPNERVIKHALNRYTKSGHLQSLMRFKFCTKCDQIKPPRTHHCSVCDKCVMKMDHHCPWVGTCVGYKNHKLFALFVTYTFIGMSFAMFTMGIFAAKLRFNKDMEKLVDDGVVSEGHSVVMIIAFVFLLIFIFGVMSLSCAHCYFICRSQTTIEFDSVTSSNNPFEPRPSICGDSFKKHFGTNPFLWLLPIPPHFDQTDGLIWELKEKYNASQPNYNSTLQPAFVSEAR